MKLSEVQKLVRVKFLRGFILLLPGRSFSTFTLKEKLQPNHKLDNGIVYMTNLNL